MVVRFVVWVLRSHTYDRTLCSHSSCMPVCASRRGCACAMTRCSDASADAATLEMASLTVCGWGAH
eukprot:4225499-Alexandrium_andersonii.AAC.1